METIAQSKPKARTPHRCMWCYRTINPGEIYDRAFNRLGYGDKPYTWINCAHCLAFVQLADIQEWCGEGITDECLIDYEPEGLWDLRLKALYRKKWRRKDGTLYPIPTKENIHG